MPGRSSDADVIAAQKEVLAFIRRGEQYRRDAARKAGVNVRTMEKWYDNDIHGWKKKVVEAEARRDKRIEEGRQPVPDLETFRREAFGHETPDHMQEWFDRLLKPGHEDFGDRVRTIILQPPEHGKTSAMEEFCVWAICKNPDVKIRYVCVSRDVAKQRLYRIRELLTSREAYEGRERDVVKEWGPFDPKTSLSTKSNPWSGEQLYVAGRTAGLQRDPTVQALGIGSAIQGARCDIIILDDIADDRNQRYPGERQKQLQWLAQQVIPRLPPLGGILVIIGTRVQPDDIYADLLRGDTFDVLAQPAIVDEEAGLTLWPEHWSLEALQKRREEVVDTYGEAIWYFTYQQQAVGVPDAPFQYDALQACKDMTKQAGQWESGWFVSVGVDPAKEGTMAVVATGLDRRSGHRHIIDCIAQKGVRDIDEARGLILGAVKNYRAQVLVIEQASQQGFFYNDRVLLGETATLGCRVRAEQTQTEKYDRDWGIEACAALFNVVLQNPAAKRYHIPWLGADSQAVMRPLLDELAAWRPSPGQRSRRKTDRVMALWLAELGLRRMEQTGDGGRKVNRAPKWLQKRNRAPAYLRSGVA